MSTGSRIVTGLYAAVTLWLAYCVVATWDTAARWSSVAMAVAGLVGVVGIGREALLADERRRTAVLQEREGRRLARQDRAADLAVRAELEAACCERWWTSLGADHDAGCARRTPRSSAA
jgi:hypothetical protein